MTMPTETNLHELAASILRKLELAGQPRLLVAIAGAPGSGKSTLAAALRERLNAESLEALAETVPMDGFHLDNKVLEEQRLLARKGAPTTFDVAGFKALLERLRANAEPAIYIPVFDRAQDLARCAARSVAQSRQVLLVEGNYLLVNEAPWSGLKGIFDMTVMLHTPVAELQHRLVQRWLAHDHTVPQAQARAAENDLPNAEYVIAHSRAADFIVDTREV